MREPGSSFGRKNFKNGRGFADYGALHDNGLVNFNLHQARASKDTVNSRCWEAQKEAQKSGSKVAKAARSSMIGTDQNGHSDVDKET